MKRLSYSLLFVFVAAVVVLSCGAMKGSGPVIPGEAYIPPSKFSAYNEQVPGTDMNIKMVPVDGGTFKMGSPSNEPNRKSDEGPQKEVEISSFWMGAFEITWDQFEPFMRSKSTSDSDVDAVTSPTPEYIDMSFGMGREGGYPVVNITNYAAIMYAKWLYEETGKFYRLPTEAEWEYACRGGTSSAYYFGDDPEDLEKYAWYNKNSPDGYAKVGQKEPNALGLYDMLGNVSEWTIDQYEEDYFDKLEGNPAKDPWFIPTTLYPRAVRGGSWMDEADALRSASRVGSSAEWKDLDPQIPKSLWWLTSAPFIGFRLVRPQVTPPKEEIEKYWIEAMEDF